MAKGWFSTIFGDSKGVARKRSKKRVKKTAKTRIKRLPAKTLKTKMLAVRPEEIKTIEDSIRETINLLYILNEIELDNQKRIEDDALLELKRRLLDISKRVGSLGGPVI